MMTHLHTHTHHHHHHHPHSTASAEAILANTTPTTTSDGNANNNNANNNNNNNNNTDNTDDDDNEPGLFEGTGMELICKLLGRALYEVGAPIVHGVVAVRDIFAKILARPNVLTPVYGPGMARYPGA